MSEELSLIIRAYNLSRAGLASVVRSVTTMARGIRSAVGASIAVLKSMTRVLFVMSAAVSASVGVAVRAFIQQRVAIVKMSAVLKATGGAAGLTGKELVKLSEKMEELTGVEDEVVLGAEAILLTFKQIKGDTFKQAILAGINMATVLENGAVSASGLQSVMKQLGMALEDPVRGISRLRKSGIALSKDQENLIKKMVGTKNIVGAQKVVLDALNSKYTGTAEAVMQADGGLTQLRRSFGNLLEDIGGVIFETFKLDKVFLDIRTRIEQLRQSGKLEEWAQNVKKIFGDVAEAAKGLFGGNDEKRSIVLQGIADMGTQLATTAVAIMVRYAPVIGTAIGKGIWAVMKKPYQDIKEAKQAVFHPIWYAKGAIGYALRKRKEKESGTEFERLLSAGKATEKSIFGEGGAGINRIWEDMLLELQANTKATQDLTIPK